MFQVCCEWHLPFPVTRSHFGVESAITIAQFDQQAFAQPCAICSKCGCARSRRAFDRESFETHSTNDLVVRRLFREPSVSVRFGPDSRSLCQQELLDDIINHPRGMTLLCTGRYRGNHRQTKRTGTTMVIEVLCCLLPNSSPMLPKLNERWASRCYDAEGTS